MPVIRITSERLNHPLEDCLFLLQELVKDIQERQDVMYQVPFDELNQITVFLDDTPEEDIPAFNEKYAYIQSYINRVSFILIQTKREIKYWNEYRNKVKSLYRRAKNNLLMNKPEIRQLKNKELQEAAVQEQVTELVNLGEGLDIIIDNLDNDIDIVKIKKEQLESANVNLNRQQKVVEDMIGLNMVPVGGSMIRLKKGDRNG